MEEGWVEMGGGFCWRWAFIISSIILVDIIQLITQSVINITDSNFI